MMVCPSSKASSRTSSMGRIEITKTLMTSQRMLAAALHCTLLSMYIELIGSVF